MNNMESATRTPLQVPYSHVNNSHIMKIVKDSYGKMNERFNVVQGPVATNFPSPSFENCHYMLSGNKFVPVPMDTFRTQPQIEEKFSLKSTPVRQTPQSMLPRVKNNNSTMFMPLPIPKQEILNTNTFQSSASSSCISKVNEQNIKTDAKPAENKGQNYKIKTVFLTGTIERLLKWNRSLDNVFCIYETIAPIVSLQEGRIKNQKIMLLRDKKGPILQVQYYSSTHIDIEDFYIGQCLRCVGRMVGFNILAAESIREATESEISTLARLSYVCDYSVTHNLSSA